MSRGISNVTKPSMDRKPRDLEHYARQTHDWGSRLPFGGTTFRVWRDVNQLTVAAAGTLVVWTPNVVQWDTDGFVLLSPMRVVIPANCGGWYKFSANCYNAVADAGLWVILRNSITIGRTDQFAAGVYPVETGPVLCQPGDLIQLAHYKLTGAAWNFTSLAESATNTHLNTLSGIRIALP